MENDHDTQPPTDPGSVTLHATSLIEKVSELLGLNASLDETTRMIGQGLHHKSWLARLEAVKSLGVLGKQAEAVLMRMLHDENECVRLLAQYELQRLALKQSSPSLPVEFTPPEVSAPTSVHPSAPLSPSDVQTSESAQRKYRYTLTWRELLEVILDDPYALEKVTGLLAVSCETVMNWIHNKARPDFRIFQQILEALPDDYDALLELIKREFPLFIPERLANSEEPLEISTPFYDQLTVTLHDSPPMFRFWSICQFVLRQAMQQLDPYRTGMMMAVMICTAPSAGQKVRSLHGYLGFGSSVWNGSWYQQPLFFGSDSLTGYAATVGNVQVIHDLKSDLKGISFYDVDDIRSVLVVPILSSDRCAGCLYVTSTSPYYFSSRRLRLVQAYAEYLARAFNPEEFYAPEQIQLVPLPYKTQISYFNSMQKYMNHNTRKIFIKQQDRQKYCKRDESEIISFMREQHEPARTRFPSPRPIVELGIQQARYQVEAELFMLLSAMSHPESRQERLA
jgi:GAF domain-containing protein